jgi:hypothetical protein
MVSTPRQDPTEPDENGRHFWARKDRQADERLGSLDATKLHRESTGARVFNSTGWDRVGG